jgi:hypothetical protein
VSTFPHQIIVHDVEPEFVVPAFAICADDRAFARRNAVEATDRKRRKKPTELGPFLESGKLVCVESKFFVRLY